MSDAPSPHAAASALLGQPITVTTHTGRVLSGTLVCIDSEGFAVKAPSECVDGTFRSTRLGCLLIPSGVVARITTL